MTEGPNSDKLAVIQKRGGEGGRRCEERPRVSASRGGGRAHRSPAQARQLFPSQSFIPTVRRVKVLSDTSNDDSSSARFQPTEGSARKREEHHPGRSQRGSITDR